MQTRLKLFIIIFCILSFISLLFGCAILDPKIPMETPINELSQIDQDHGVVVGSILIKGKGKESILGFKHKWILEVTEYNNPESKVYSIEVFGEEEKIFVTEMPAGEYRFGQIRFGNAYAYLDQRFTVYPAKTVYIGRLLIQFGHSLNFLFKVEDAKAQILAATEKKYGNLVSDAVTDLMGKIEIPRTFDEVYYRSGESNSILLYTHKGGLTIGERAVEFHSKKKEMTVPYSSVSDVQFGNLKAAGFFSKYAIVKFRAGGSEEVAGFRGNVERLSQEIYTTLKKAYVDYKRSEAK